MSRGRDGDREVDVFGEIEVELTPEAPDDLLDELVARLEAAGATTGDTRPKVARALGSRASEPPDVTVPRLTGRARIGRVVAAAIAAGYCRLVEHDLGVRLGDDPEDVHQARVATRRLRSDLRTFKKLLDPDWVTATRGELKWLGDALGAVRDADVLADRLRADAAHLADIDTKPAIALVGRVRASRDESHARLLVALDSERYSRLLDTLADAARTPPLAPRRSPPRRTLRRTPRQPPMAMATRRRTSAPPRSCRDSSASRGSVSPTPSPISPPTRPTTHCTRSASAPSEPATPPKPLRR